jgi:hypothetical protein
MHLKMVGVMSLLQQPLSKLQSTCRAEDDISGACDRITGGKRQPLDVGRVLVTRHSSSNSSSSNAPAGLKDHHHQQQQQQPAGAAEVKYFVNICSCGVGATTPSIVNKLKWLRTLCE